MLEWYLHVQYIVTSIEDYIIRECRNKLHIIFISDNNSNPYINVRENASIFKKLHKLKNVILKHRNIRSFLSRQMIIFLMNFALIFNATRHLHCSVFRILASSIKNQNITYIHILRPNIQSK